MQTNAEMIPLHMVSNAMSALLQPNTAITESKMLSLYYIYA